MLRHLETEQVDLTKLGDEEVQVQYYGRRVMRQHYLDSLPVKPDGEVDFFALGTDAGNRLVSPIDIFGRLLNTKTESLRIRKELLGRGLEPREPQVLINLESI